MDISDVLKICNRIKARLFDKEFILRVENDNEFSNGRIFIQVMYDSPCTKTGDIKTWHGRKWYLSKHMTTDEIIKTAFAAFKSCVEHEVMEGFSIDGVVLFNPHVNYESLLSISNNEIFRKK